MSTGLGYCPDKNAQNSGHYPRKFRTPVRRRANAGTRQPVSCGAGCSELPEPIFLMLLVQFPHGARATRPKRSSSIPEVRRRRESLLAFFVWAERACRRHRPLVKVQRRLEKHGGEWGRSVSTLLRSACPSDLAGFFARVKGPGDSQVPRWIPLWPRIHPVACSQLAGDGDILLL